MGMGEEKVSIQHVAISPPIALTTTTAAPATLDSASLNFPLPSKDIRLSIVEEMPPPESLQDTEEDVDSQLKGIGKG